MSSKIIRDPLYNYISINAEQDHWLLDLLDCPEVQRLRRIHQLGVSYLTYPGADHNRLAHSLGVVHLMALAIQHIKQNQAKAGVDNARAPLLATALLHDVGHGPFSHLFEPCLGVKHEFWSKKVVLDEDTEVHQVLRKQGHYLPQIVADLIDTKNQNHPAWWKCLLSSQLDMDRLDYLRRDSLFTGSGYGHFDWYRLLNTFEIDELSGDIIWPEKAKLAIEEYIFSRYYMYQNVYLHKTTRGFQKMLEAMWERARIFYDNGENAALVPAIKTFWDAQENKKDDEVESGATARQYLDIEEFTVLFQIQEWTTHPDKALSDLARRFLDRKRFAMVRGPDFSNPFASNIEDWEADLREMIGRESEYDPPEMYCLRDQVEAEYNQPYFPEKESDEQSGKNAIRIKVDGESSPVEVSELLPRLKPLIQEQPINRYRYYVPRELRLAAEELRDVWGKRK